MPIVAEIKRSGTILISCFVTDEDITDVRRLYGHPNEQWPDAAKLMFHCASELPAGTSFENNLREYGWRIDDGAKLFAQVNQSEMLTEFLNLVLSPLDDKKGQSASVETTIVVPSATVQDERGISGELHTAASTHTGSPRITMPAVASRTSWAGGNKALLLFLHGLGGEAASTWGRLPEFLMADRETAERFAVGYYSYPTSLFRLPFSSRAPKIQELAAGLRTQIEHEQFERIDLICHSLGGLIARRYLIEEVKANRPLRVRRLALFAVPHNGAGLASVARFVSWRQNQIKQLCRDADIIEFLNEDWFHFIVNNQSLTTLKTKFFVGTQDEVVDRFSVINYWGNPDVETIVGRGHLNLVKPDRADDLVVRALRTFILE